MNCDRTIVDKMLQCTHGREHFESDKCKKIADVSLAI